MNAAGMTFVELRADDFAVLLNENAQREAMKKIAKEATERGLVVEQWRDEALREWVWRITGPSASLQRLLPPPPRGSEAGRMEA